MAQSGSAVLYDTPFDETIAHLSRALDNTRIYYGDADHLREMKARRKTADDIYSEARPSALAKRTIFNSQAAGEKNCIGAQELVHAVESGELDLAALPQSNLPAELQGLDKPALAAYIDTQSRQRKQLQSPIQDLAKKRQRFIEDKVKKEKDSGADSLDRKIYRCIQVQAARKDIDYTGGPAYSAEF